MCEDKTFKMVQETNNMIHQVWVGSELGVVKGVNLANGAFVNYGNLKVLDKTQGVTVMTKLLPNNEQDTKGVRFALGRRDGSACIFDSHTNEFSTPLCCGTSPVCGVVALPQDVVVTCTEKGLLKQWKPKEDDIAVYDNDCAMEKQVGSDIQTMVTNTTRTLLATGGQENDLKLWNVEDMSKPVFAAKNVRNDFLNLRVPVWVTAAEFLKDSESEIVVGTGNHTVRTYDTRVKRRPVLDIVYHEHPITSISVTQENKTVLVGNSAGFMGEVDLRTGHQVGGFKGMCGGIRDIVCHETQPYVVVCGLDRFVRVYDLKSRRLEKKIYLKSNLNCVSVTSDELQLTNESHEAGRKRTKEEEEEEVEIKSEEEEGVWECMQVVKEKKKKPNEHDIDAVVET